MIMVELVEEVMVEFGIADGVQVTTGCVLFAKSEVIRGNW